MAPDVKSLFLANVIITGFVGCALLLYQRTRKTYPGYGLWMAGNFVLTAGYLALLSRVVVPEFASIVMTNAILVTGVVLRLDGSALFLRGKGVGRWLYLLGPVVGGLVIVIHLSGGTAPQRSLVVSAAIFPLMLYNASLFFRPRQKVVRPLSSAIGYCLILWAAMLMYRALSWIASPSDGMFDPNAYQLAYTMSTLVLEVALSLGLFMLNGARLEEELRDSNRELDIALSELMRTMGQLKVLAGVLPICAHCKKIRDDGTGVWHQLEDYITRHSQAGFTHGICPECVAKHYPDFETGE